MGEVPAGLGRRRRDAGAGPHRRDVPPLDPARPGDAGEARRGPPRRGRARRPRARRRAPGATQREAPAVTGARVPAVGGTRDVPAADDIARDYILLGLRLDQHLPGTVDGYFGPAALKATVDMEQLAVARRARRRRCGPAGAPPGRGPRSPTGVLARRAAHRARDPGAGEGRRADLVPRPGRALSRPPPAAGRTRLRAGRARSGRPAPGQRRPRRPARRRGRGLDTSIPSACRPSSTSSCRGTGSARARCRPAAGRGPSRVTRPRPAVVRLQLVRRRVPLARRPQPRPPVRPPHARRYRGPRDLPRAPPRARAQGAGAGRGARAARVVDPADQHARVPAVRGPRERRSHHRRPAGRDGRPPRRPGAVAGLPMAGDADALADGRGAPGRRGGAAGDARRVADQRRADDPCRRRAPGTGGRLHDRGRAHEPRHSGQADGVRLAPAVAPVRLRVHGGRGAPVAVARRGPRRATWRPLRPAAAGAADARGDPRRKPPASGGPARGRCSGLRPSSPRGSAGPGDTTT